MIDTRKIDQFIVKAYRPDYDCADLAIDVARELFGREIDLPTLRPRPQGTRGQAAALRVAMGELARPVDTPIDGDLVLMRLKGTEIAGHIGTYLHVAHEPHVLHTSLAMGFAALHKIRDLARYGLQLEGYYNGSNK